MVVLFSLAASSCRSPYEKYSICDPIISGHTLHIPVVQEKGKYKHEIGPCPRPERIPQSYTTYLLTYKLPLSDGTNSCLPTIQLLHDATPSNLPKGTTKENSGAYQFESVPYSKKELSTLEHSGFSLSDADWVAHNSEEGKLVFGSPLGNHGIQIYSFKTSQLHSCPLDFGKMIWDYTKNRVVLCGDSRMNAIVTGIPEAITIWNYSNSTTNTWRLACPTKADFERTRIAQNK